MRTTQLVRAALFLAIAGALGTSSAIAQSSVAPIIAHSAQSGDASLSGATKKVDLVNAANILAKVTDRPAIQNGSVSTAPLAQATPTQNHSSATSHASTNTSAAGSGANAVSLLDEHKLNVKVQYDPRPVGGILTVRVSMTPTFRGIGVSTRPATSRSMALAVDEFTQEAVNKLVEELTEEIKAEFKAMHEANAVDASPQVN
jgi:hypothetical protein